MLEVDIPGYGMLRLEHLVSDYTGTLSQGGKLLPGIKKQLNAMAQLFTVHVVTADTFGTARNELAGVECTIKMLASQGEDVQKEKYILSLGAERVVAIGNGNNDRKMLSAARLGIAVLEGEGASGEAIRAADIVVKSALDAFGILLNRGMIKATLRF